MMKNPLARCRQAGSFIAGLFIGLSIVVPVFAMMVANPSDWQTFFVLGAAFILALGITLQVVITAKPRRRRTIDTKLEAFPIRLMKLIHEQ
jgi:fucose permease